MTVITGIAEALKIVEAAHKESRRANLRGAVLYGADLRGADLRNVDLDNADLERANLRDANLSGAHLGGANLYGVTLHRASLPGAGLHRANLGRANLSGANLDSADLSGADLRNADLFRASLDHASLYHADLRGAYLSGAGLSGSEGGLLQIVDLPSGTLTLIPTCKGWHLSIGCWSGSIGDLEELFTKPDEEWPEARGAERVVRESFLRAALHLVKLHTKKHDHLIDTLAETWGQETPQKQAESETQNVRQ